MTFRCILFGCAGTESNCHAKKALPSESSASTNFATRAWNRQQIYEIFLKYKLKNIEAFFILRMFLKNQPLFVLPKFTALFLKRNPAKVHI